jgi:hypothetical protein
MVRPKTTLTKVAWMRNWFNVWLSRRWVGNYDLLLTSSSLTQQFFQSFHGPHLHTPLHTLTDLAPDLIRLLSDCVSSEVPFCVPFSSPKETDARSVSVLGAGLLSSPCPRPRPFFHSLFPVILKSKSFESLPISPNSLPIVVAV